jgi:hypothetical protein
MMKINLDTSPGRAHNTTIPQKEATMTTSLNPARYEDVWREVYSNSDMEYRWKFQTKKEAERWRFRALGYTRAVRHYVETYVHDKQQYTEVVRGINRMEHLLRQTGPEEWTVIIRPLPAGPKPEVREVALDTLDNTGKIAAINARDMREVLKERGDVRTRPETAEDVLTSGGMFPFLDNLKSEK